MHDAEDENSMSGSGPAVLALTHTATPARARCGEAASDAGAVLHSYCCTVSLLFVTLLLALLALHSWQVTCGKRRAVDGRPG